MTRIVLASIGAVCVAAMLVSLTKFTGLERQVFAYGTGFCALLFLIAIVHPDTRKNRK